MASINEMTDLLRPIIDEATARAALEGEIHMLEHLGKCLDGAQSVEHDPDLAAGASRVFEGEGPRMSVDLSNYEEVDERLRKFFDKYPLGSMQTVTIEYRDLPAAHLGGESCLHVIYHAAAFRNPEDERPGQGVASEPFPGLTNYTKGSEIMNAETSAWGRALVALGFVAKKVASANEVRNRGTSSQPQPTGQAERRADEADPEARQAEERQPGAATDHARHDRRKPSPSSLDGRTTSRPVRTGRRRSSSRGLTERPLPSIEHPTDVPVDDAEFEHEPDDGKDTPMELIS